jgi:hypothetical protein
MGYKIGGMDGIEPATNGRYRQPPIADSLARASVCFVNAKCV